MLWPERGLPARAQDDRSTRVTLSTRVILFGAVVVASIALRSVTLAIEGPLVLAIGMQMQTKALRREQSFRAIQGAVLSLDQSALRLRSGSSLTRAFADGVGQSPLPEDHPYVAAVKRSAAGMQLSSALNSVVDDGESEEGGEQRQAIDPSVQLLATSIDVLTSGGGPAARALERVADTLRERLAADADSETQAQQAMASAALLSLLPALFATLNAIVEPTLRVFYLRSVVGCACVVSATLLTWFGWLWIERLVWAGR